MDVRVLNNRLVVESVISSNHEAEYIERKDITTQAINALFEIFAENPKFQKDGWFGMNHVVGKDGDKNIVNTLALVGDKFTIVENEILKQYMDYKEKFEQSEQNQNVANSMAAEYERKIEELTTDYNRQLSELKEKIASYEIIENDSMSYTE